MATPATFRLTEPISGRDHTRGPRTAQVSLVKYGDFECPYFRAAESIVSALIEAFGDQLTVAFRHFPLRSVHPHAQIAAEVAEAAAAQGKFWEMRDMLFAHQHALDDAHLVQYAAELALDVDRVRGELASHAHAGRVAHDWQSGLDSGVIDTPVFYIDDTRYDGPLALRNMHAAIRELHPDLAAAVTTVPNIRIPRVKWPHVLGLQAD
jgi:protein-disulfide isomerase